MTTVLKGKVLIEATLAAFMVIDPQLLSASSKFFVYTATGGSAVCNGPNNNGGGFAACGAPRKYFLLKCIIIMHLA
jgi:hypothetical protein